MKLYLKLLAGVALCAAAAMPAAAQTGARRPGVGVADSVTLRGAQATETIRHLPVLRSYNLASLRAQPVIGLGAYKLDMRPFFNNPAALVNVGARLQALPQQVKVTTNTDQIVEVAQGLIIHDELAFTILPGQCTTAASRAAIEAAGVHCLTRTPLAAHLAAFSQRGDPHYIADPGKRARAAANFQNYYQQQDAIVTQHIADLRKALADPNKRAQAEGKLGAAKVAQFAALSDEQIKDEMANTATRSIRHTLFVPKTPTNEVTPFLKQLDSLPTATGKIAPEHTLPPSPPQAAQTTDTDLGREVYLTGFTLGDSYEWSYEIDATVDPCSLALDAATYGIAAIFGISACPIDASVTPYAGFDYGFGLRFPIETDLHYHREVHSDRTAKAQVTVTTFRPTIGNIADFASTGLDSHKLFDGKELVAQVGANAGFKYDLPIIGSGDIGVSPYLDLTDYLPAPFTGGHFTPPAPGPTGLDGAPIVFDQLDLLGGMANLGVAGAEVFPAIKVGLVSNGLTFDLRDKNTNAVTKVTHPNQVVPISTNNATGYSTRFQFGTPVYNLAMRVTPGIDLHLFVDLAIWSDSWDPQIWFPQLEIELPPGGVNFSCHDGTVCTRDYAQAGSAAVQSQATTYTAAPAMLKWANVHFHQNGDGKDWNTQVDLMLKDGAGGIVAQNHLGVHTDFGDNTTTQDYPINPVRPISKNDLLGNGSFDMVIHPVGNDHWNYTATVTLGWDDGTVSSGAVQNYVDQNMSGRSAKFAQGFIAK